jgi:hypothetical protein
MKEIIVVIGNIPQLYFKEINKIINKIIRRKEIIICFSREIK